MKTIKAINYNDLFEVSRKELNETNDCMVKALAVAIGGYRKAHQFLKEQGRKNREGFYSPYYLKHPAVKKLLIFKESSYFYGLYYKDIMVHASKELKKDISVMSSFYPKNRELTTKGKGITVKEFIDSFSGQYIVQKNNHCFFIDCDNRIVYNYGKTNLRTIIKEAYKIEL